MHYQIPTGNLWKYVDRNYRPNVFYLTRLKTVYQYLPLCCFFYSNKFIDFYFSNLTLQFTRLTGVYFLYIAIYLSIYRF